MDAQVGDIPEKLMELAGEFSACRDAFIALGDENRQFILIALLENYGGMRVGEITACTNLSRPAVSHHLKILKDAGIVSMFKRGTMNFYHVDTNKSRWDSLISLIVQINDLVREVSERRDCVQLLANHDPEIQAQTI